MDATGRELLLRTLRRYWDRVPELRLGQLIAIQANHWSDRGNSDPFYMGDSELLGLLEEELKKPL